MKLDAKTISVLKNFSSINPSILFREGDVLSTISPNKTIMAKAKVPNTFPKKFAIYNLSQFLNFQSTFDEPELSFGDRSVTITDKTGNKEAPYVYADEATIKTPPDKEIVLPSIDLTFQITTGVINEIEKALGILGLPEIAVVGDGSSITVQAIDSKNPSGNIVKIKLGATDKTFKSIFKSENMKLLPGTYEVSLSSRGISHWKGQDAEYWIAVESSSTY
jgi:hypothetical protein